MEINKEQIEKLKSAIGESELKKIIPEAFKQVYNKRKIYFYDGITGLYKLNKIEGNFGWISLNDSECMANGTTKNAQSFLDYAEKNLYVFDNLKDFLNSELAKKHS